MNNKITTNPETPVNLGDTLFYVYIEFDGKGKVEGKVTEVHDDHFILSADGINYWFESEDLGERVFVTNEEAEYILYMADRVKNAKIKAAIYFDFITDVVEIANYVDVIGTKKSQPLRVRVYDSGLMTRKEM